MNTKIGRNDPCPCGSGKKYKQCCLGKETKKTYTPSGKRKFKAKVLNPANVSQEIFSQSASTQKMPDTLPEPGSLLKFRQASKDYRAKQEQESAEEKVEEKKAPTPKPEQKPESLEGDFSATKEDLRKE